MSDSKQLLADLYGSSYQYAVKLVLQRHQAPDVMSAEDIVSAAFVKVVRSVLVTRPHVEWRLDYLVNLLFLSVKREVIDRSRKPESRHRDRIARIDAATSGDAVDGDRSYAVDVEDPYAVCDTAAMELQELLLELTARERRTFLLTYQGYSSVEIASAEHSTHRAVRARLRRARVKLRAKLLG